MALPSRLRPSGLPCGQPPLGRSRGLVDEPAVPG